MITLIYSWWILFVRLAEPGNHMEALTSRPQLLSGVGKIAFRTNHKALTIYQNHANQYEMTAIHIRVLQFSEFSTMCRN